MEDLPSLRKSLGLGGGQGLGCRVIIHYLRLQENANSKGMVCRTPHLFPDFPSQQSSSAQLGIWGLAVGMTATSPEKEQFQDW